MKRGLYVGRFQPFHNGHKAVIDLLCDEVDELIIGIGSAQMSHDIRHPFTAGERVLMIQRVLADAKIPVYIIPLEDIKRNALWVAHVVSMVPPFDVVYTSNPLVIRLFTEAGFRVESPPMYQRQELSGTAIRQKMLEGGDWKQYVPEAAGLVIESVGGVERIRDISRTDE
ncbi:MAG: nicotinamide-nucleotide adenylyltransferase [Methanocorpusculum sp.]|nr:nicotinamide-nucleotide adenylyltransferase [Methanocorpusculum sp.]MBQ9830946.1 nicotinamide-nucleotide adenylyltransferase [Methanocorpusculum sp.]